MAHRGSVDATSPSASSDPKSKRFSSGQIAPASQFQMSSADLDAINQDQMTEENKRNLEGHGGVHEVARKLGVDLKAGLTSEEARTDFAARKAAFGANAYPEPPMKGFWTLWLESFNDLTLIILIVAAVVSLVVGAIEDPTKGWIDGVAILIAVLIVAFVTAGNDYSKEQQFRALNAVKDSIDVKVIRDGSQTNVNTAEICVGEVIFLVQGDKIPCDCVFIRGEDVESNESSLTGEPEDIKKNAAGDPFLLSGCQITKGRCRALCIAVGERSRWGRIKARLATEAEDTPLQEKLDEMAKQIGYIGAVAAFATMVAMIVLWFADESVQQRGTSVESWIIHAFIVAVTIIVVAIPEGLPLAVTISLAYSTRKMLTDNNLIRVLAACETMGNATNICSDKTGTLTENRMTVVEAWLAGRHYDQKAGIPNGEAVPDLLRELLCEGIAVNSDAVVKYVEGRPEVTGSKTEGALLMMGEKWGLDYLSVRERTSIKKAYPFSSEIKMMSSLVERPGGAGYRLYVKGASEIVMGRCKNVIAADGTIQPLTEAIREELLDRILGMAKGALRTIGIAHRDMALDELPADYETNPPANDLTFQSIVGIMDPLREDVAEAVKTCQRAGIMVRMVTGDNLETAKAIARQCGILTSHGDAIEGPNFREMTPEQLDRILPRLQVLARSSPDDKHTLVVRLNGKKIPKDQKAWQEMHPGCDWDTLRDRLLPGYKEEWLAARRGDQAEGEVVGVTGDGTNDAPALKAADVGLSMGLSGTEVAKEASDIVIMDDRFSSIVKAVLWGRSVYDNIRKFLQFQLTVNVVALLITFIAAVLSYDPPLNPVMMLWVNLIMDTMGALALGTEPPTMALLDRKPYRRSGSLVSRPMWRNILTQSLFQLIVLLVLLLAGADSHLDPDQKGFLSLEGNKVYDGLNGPCLNQDDPSRVNAAETGPNKCLDGRDHTHFTIIFNAFVWCQIFNELNARRINDDWNVFSGVLQNPLFVGVLFLSAGMQLFIVEVGGDFTKTQGLSGTHWLISIGIGFISLPLGVLMRFIPVAEDPKSFGGYNDPNTEGDSAAVEVAGGAGKVHVISAEDRAGQAPGSGATT